MPHKLFSCRNTTAGDSKKKMNEKTKSFSAKFQKSKISSCMKCFSFNNNYLINHSRNEAKEAEIKLERLHNFFILNFYSVQILWAFYILYFIFANCTFVFAYYRCKPAYQHAHSQCSHVFYFCICMHEQLNMLLRLRYLYLNLKKHSYIR